MKDSSCCESGHVCSQKKGEQLLTEGWCQTLSGLQHPADVTMLLLEELEGLTA